ncbi:flippase [Halorarius halobius]|uniref:flippase n=1 Tax=Halorarius halobius TaxID=2962671 RepID=UPI0020CF028C|nr:flippase [Halorarius halobius]
MSGDDAAGGPDSAADDESAFATVRDLFKGGGALLFGLVLELGISFVAKIIIAQELERVSYGTVSLGIITAAIVSTLVMLGLNTGIGRYLPRYDTPEERRGVLVSGFEVAIPLSVAAGAAIVLGAPLLAEVFNDQSLVVVFRIFGVAVPFGTVMKLALGSIQGLQDSVPRIVVQNITFPVTRFVGIAIAILLGAGVFGVSIAYVLSYVFAAAAGVYFLATRTRLFDRSVEAVRMRRELLVFSLPLVVTAAMSIVLSDIDMYMLGILRGPAVVADYNVIYPLAQLLTAALGAFGFLFMPAVSELDAEGERDQLKRLYQVATKWIVVATLPVFLVFVFFPDRVIPLTFGAKYAQAAPSLAVLATGFFIHTAFGLNKGALTSLGHTRLIMYDDIVGAAVNVALNLVLIPLYGLWGAAWATTLSYVVLNLLYSGQLYRRTSAHPLSTALAWPALIGGVAMGAVYALGRAYLVVTPLTLVGLFAAFGVIYGLGVLRFGIEPEEVRLVVSFEERFGVDLGPLKRVARLFM